MACLLVHRWILWNFSKISSNFLQEFPSKLTKFLFLGLAGLVAALGYSAYKYRDVRRGGMSTSVFLMQTRVLAQGTVVSCLTVGLAVQMFNKWVLHGGNDE
jgi:hypothetical protein